MMLEIKGEKIVDNITKSLCFLKYKGRHYLCRRRQRKRKCEGGGSSRLFQIGQREGGVKLFIKKLRGGSAV